MTPLVHDLVMTVICMFVCMYVCVCVCGGIICIMKFSVNFKALKLYINYLISHKEDRQEGQKIQKRHHDCTT